MDLIKRNFILNNMVAATCFIVVKVVEGVEQFLFKAYDAATFLGYKRQRGAVQKHVRGEWKITWGELIADASKRSVALPEANWSQNTIFITEAGLYALIFRSKMPDAIKFQKWVFEDVLPSLRRTGKYEIDNLRVQNADLVKNNSVLHDQLVNLNQALIKFNENLENARQDAEKARQDAEKSRRDAEKARKDTVALCNRITDIAEDVISKPKQEALLHALTLHQITDGKGSDAVAFTRCQKRSLSTAIRKLHNKNNNAVEIYRANFDHNIIMLRVKLLILLINL